AKDRFIVMFLVSTGKSGDGAAVQLFKLFEEGNKFFRDGQVAAGNVGLDVQRQQRIVTCIVAVL
ncbi:MAG: hypothetical protein IKI42_00345, partial [Clostridia bacterium]|nr:hypothetical protein [Clostridia bacterium]